MVQFSNSQSSWNTALFPYSASYFIHIILKYSYSNLWFCSVILEYLSYNSDIRSFVATQQGAYDIFFIIWWRLSVCLFCPEYLQITGGKRFVCQSQVLLQQPKLNRVGRIFKTHNNTHISITTRSLVFLAFTASSPVKCRAIIHTVICGKATALFY